MLERTGTRYADAIERTESRVMKAILMSRARSTIANLISPQLLDAFMSLQNEKLGFKTDKADGYGREVVKKCIVSALMYGVFPFNNEFNIIKGDVMIVQNGWRRKLHEIEGLDFPKLSPIDLIETPRYYKVLIRAEWKLHGVADSWDKYVLVDRGSQSKDAATTIDNLMGRVERRMLEAIYKKLRGEPFGDADEEATDDTVPAPVDPARDAALARLRAAGDAGRKAGVWTDAQSKESVKKHGGIQSMTTEHINALADEIEKLIVPPPNAKAPEPNAAPQDGPAPPASSADPLDVLGALIERAKAAGVLTDESWAGVLEDKGFGDLAAIDTAAIGELIAIVEAKLSQQKTDLFDGQGKPDAQAEGR